MNWDVKAKTNIEKNGTWRSLAGTQGQHVWLPRQQRWGGKRHGSFGGTESVNVIRQVVVTSAATTAGSVELQVPLQWKSPLATVDISCSEGRERKKKKKASLFKIIHAWGSDLSHYDLVTVLCAIYALERRQTVDFWTYSHHRTAKRCHR